MKEVGNTDRRRNWHVDNSRRTFFSTFLSSPWTTAKFTETEEDRIKIRRLYMMACAASLITALILSLILKQSWPFIAALILCIIYIVVYERALEGRI